MTTKSLFPHFAIAVAVVSVGCSSGLPRIEPDLFEKRFPPIPEGAAPVFSWMGERKGIFTYWYKQDIHVSVRAWFPPGLQDIQEARWQVSARNAEGKRVPFIGFIRTHVNENGTTLNVLVPSVDLNALPDGLYIALKADMTVKDGEVSRIVPTAMLHEIRHHTFKPFRVKIPLIPGKVSPVTPMPPPLPKKPAGTAIPFG